MKLEDQCVALEYAKRLKELGVKQESLFYWIDSHGDQQRYCIGYQDNMLLPIDDGGLDYSAFATSELGEMLPDWTETVKRLKDDWVCIVRHKHNDINDHSFGQTEVNCRAMMLIYLIENDLISIDANS